MLVAATSRQENFVDISVSAVAWIALGVIILTLLGIDLFRHRNAEEPTIRSAAAESEYGWRAASRSGSESPLFGAARRSVSTFPAT